LAETLFSIAEQTASDGYRWRYRRYVPPGRVRAEIVCVHGIQSHGGWYEYSCGRLCQAGFGVSFLDRRGSGLNERDRGDAPGFRRLLDDIAEFLKEIRTRAENQRVFLVAISWGGKLAVALQRRHPGLVDGLALLCPGFLAQVGPSFVQRLRIFGCRLLRPRKLFDIPLDDPELFTANPRWLQFLREDRLGLRQATARFLLESARLDVYLRFCKKHVRVPVLLLLAENDRIIDNNRTRRFVESFAAADKQMIEYPAAHHTLEFEPEPERFIRDLQTWLERHS
jgi:alpha-beta hydrolase superfamily lysophospholipase